MARGKKDSAEQVVNLLRQIEVAVANGKTTPRSGGTLPELRPGIRIRLNVLDGEKRINIVNARSEQAKKFVA